MQPGSFQWCLMTKQEAVATNRVKHRMFPVNNQRHFFTVRDQALTGGDCQEAVVSLSLEMLGFWTCGHCPGQSLESQDDL